MPFVSAKTPLKIYLKLTLIVTAHDFPEKHFVKKQIS